MSDSTKANDKGYKFFSYQLIPSLKEYVLIDSTQYAVDVIRKQTDGSWIFAKFSSLNSSILLHSIGLTLAFNDLYYRVSLTK